MEDTEEGGKERKKGYLLFCTVLDISIVNFLQQYKI